MSAAATIGAIAALAGAVGSTTLGIVSGSNNNAAQKKALAAQTTAQQTAVANSLSTERNAAVASNAANQQTPNVSAILRRAATMGSSGLSSTMLTGPGGVTGGLNLGKTTLLGS